MSQPICLILGGFHCTNILQCLQCGLSYCQSCSRGCPRCHFGADMERRCETREPLSASLTVLRVNHEE